MNPRRILGVDPGTRITGWGVVDQTGNRFRLVACGAVKTRSVTNSGRLAEVAAEIRRVIAAHGPVVVAVERQFFGKNASSAFVVGMARGAVLVAAGEAALDVVEFPPATVKKAVCGNGAATKHRVAQMVRILLGLAETPEPADVTDALAVALAAAHRAPPADEDGAAPPSGRRDGARPDPIAEAVRRLGPRRRVVVGPVAPAPRGNRYTRRP